MTDFIYARTRFMAKQEAAKFLLTRGDVSELLLLAGKRCELCRGVAFRLRRILADYDYTVGNVQVACSVCCERYGRLTLTEAKQQIRDMEKVLDVLYWEGDLDEA